MIRLPPRSTQSRSSAASDVYKRQIITMAIIILFTIVGTMEVPVFDKVKPFLFTTHMIVWRNLFESPLPMEQIRTSIYALLGHIVVFMGISIVYFNKKDILS